MAAKVRSRSAISRPKATVSKPAFLPFARPAIDEETISAVSQVLRSGWITTGPQVEAFEAALSRYLDGRTVRAFTSATGALEVALQACGIGHGDEVIVPAMTFAATANVVLRVGARPVFADVDLATRNIDLGRAEKAITPLTRAIMPVHFAGLPVDMDALYNLAERRGLRVIEDAAHAIGSSYRRRRIGSFGDFVAFSFHPNKNLTTIEGGALSIREPAEARRVERLRFHGIEREDKGDMDVLEAGGKYNLTDVAACVGLGQLRKLEQFNQRRRTLAARYFERLKTDPEMLLPARGDEGHSWHMFAPLLPLEHMRIGQPQFIEEMRKRGIGVGIHYPALHLFSLYRKMGYRIGDFPNAERIGQSTVTLPLFPAMSENDVDRVCESCSGILGKFRKDAP
ncbi:MAG TPA: DegT/DnrJ/EryC1/StrS aminotransferase family protein [Burkholderiales bacterium]|nr:DegT/DnrJ/EryC1/StrS aminotransferase family protein [Burkholderiales bacterium]